MPVHPTVLRCYGDAWARRNAIVVTYLALRLAAYALIAPLVGAAVNLAVSLSAQSALTDQDIAAFILTPGGLVATVVVLSILLLAEVLGFAVMSAVWRVDADNSWVALRSGVYAVLRRARALAVFAVQFILRILALLLPFAVAALAIAWLALSEHDINYYLTNRPPRAMLAAALIGLVLLSLAALLLARLSAWALALHLVLFGDVAPRRAFAQSARRMQGRRLHMQRDLLVWLGLRLVLAGAIGFGAGALLHLAAAATGAGLRLVLTLSLVIVALWMLAGMVLNAVALGALARLVGGRFEGHAKLQPVPPGAAAGLRRRLAVGLALATVLGAGGFWAGAWLMDSVQTEDDVEIIAHRGAAGSRPENTLASMRKAIEDGADWIELDVQETIDGHVVVVHDSDFMKLAGVSTKVWNSTLDDLTGIDIGSWFGADYAEERTPLLREVLELAKGRAKVLIELKYYGHDQQLETRVGQIVDDLGMGADVAVMSLKYPGVQKMQALRPEWRSGVLAATAVGNLAGLDADFIAISSAMLGPRLLQRVQGAGKDVYVWTVNDPLDMSRMISQGVDGLITDEPALAREVLRIRAGLSTPQRLMLWMSESLGLKLNRKVYRDSAP